MLPLAKQALDAFIDAMLPGDRAGLIKFNREAVVVQELTGDRELLKAGVKSLSLKYDNSVAAGIRAGLDMLDGAEQGKEKMLVLVCDGDVDDCMAPMQEAVEKGVKIYCINVMDGDARKLEEIAEATGGLYYYAATAGDVENAVSELQGDTIESVDMTDSDGDGLYDVYEIRGMRLPNGQTVYTDPQKSDTDGDGISDYDAMGGDPVIESYMIDENVYSCTLFHSEVYGKLSEQFVYVDGTLNRDGKQYFGKMDYLPYSNRFIKQKYKEEEEVNMFDGIVRMRIGNAGIHGLYSDQLNQIGIDKRSEYYFLNTLIIMGITMITFFDLAALDCFLAYSMGMGGDAEAWDTEYTRRYINIKPWVMNEWSYNNSAKEYYDINMCKTMKAVESVTNRYNTEVYMSVSPDKKMDGCLYVDVNDKLDVSAAVTAFLNSSIFGTFNDADAGITLHCVYNPETDEYDMDFKYYLIDYYDFSFFEELYEQDAVGLAQSYELYGYLSWSCKWKKGEKHLQYIEKS